MKQVLVALLLLPMVFATADISTSETTLDVTESGIAITSAYQLRTEEPIGNLTLILTPESRSIDIRINGQQRACLIQAEFARCGSIEAGTHNISTSYYTSYPLGEVGTDTIIRYTDRLPYPAGEQHVSMRLPIGYIVPREKGKDESFYLSPTPQEVYSDGQQIILSWEQTGQEFPISAVMRKVITQPIAWIIATILSLLVAAGAVVYIVLRKPQTKVVKVKPKAKKKPKAVVPTLIDNEQQVVNYLKENGQVWQKQIQQATGFSKAKVSRVIRNLEARGVIEKTPYGNTNKISLKEQ